MRDNVPAKRVLIARLIALAADAVQIGLLPLFVGGFVSPLANLLDVAVAVLQIFLLGWHVAFLPTMIAELLPVADIFPSWTIAVFFVTRHMGTKKLSG